MSPELTAIAFGLLCAASYGSGDFLGGIATKRTNVFGVVAISHSFGILLMVVCALLAGEAVPPASDLLLGGIAGIAGMVGLAALYRALATGQMGIAAPVSAVLAAALPVLFSLFTRELPDGMQIVGFGLAFVSVVLVSCGGGAVWRVQGIPLALLAGVGFGVFFILLDLIQSDAVFWPLVAARVASTSILWATIRVRRQEWRPGERRTLVIILLSSTLDVFANVFFLLASQSGRLDIAAVVTSLYPAGTLILARIFLNERLTTLQTSGVCAALIAIILISI